MWCTFHQLHLIVKCVLQVLDNFEWGADVGPLPSKYFGGVATISNVWRSVAIGKNIRRLAASHKYDCPTLDKIPGRVFRGRWGSIDSVELALINCLRYLPGIFHTLFGGTAEGDTVRKPGVGGVGDEETAAYQEEQRNWRNNANVLLHSPHFQTMLVISNVAKRPFNDLAMLGAKIDQAIQHFGPQTREARD